MMKSIFMLVFFFRKLKILNVYINKIVRIVVSGYFKIFFIFFYSFVINNCKINFWDYKSVII